MSTEVLEPQFAQALVASVRETFEAMVAMSPAHVDAPAAPRPVVDRDVVASLRFTGSKSGVVALGAASDLALDVCASMLMQDRDEITDRAEIADAFGEVANMVTGHFKNTWVAAGHVMDLAIPAVTFGEPLTLPAEDLTTTAFAADFTFDRGELRIELRMHD